MIETISPVVHGGRNHKYFSAIALHSLGATLTAALLGFILGGVGDLTGGPWGVAGLNVAAAVASLYAFRELFRLPIPLPDLDRQVPEWWRTFYSKNVAAFLYGAGLGVGFLTFLSFGTLAAVAVAAVIGADPLTGALLLAPFGLARGVSVLVGAFREPLDVLHRLEAPRVRTRARLLNGLAMLVCAVATVAVAI